MTLDVNEDWPAIGRRHWERAGVAERVELRVGLAMECLDRLRDEVRFLTSPMSMPTRSFTTPTTSAHWAGAERGIVALDNVLWGGAVADPEDQDRQTLVLRA